MTVVAFGLCNAYALDRQLYQYAKEAAHQHRYIYFVSSRTDHVPPVRILARSSQRAVPNYRSYQRCARNVIHLALSAH